MKNISRKTLVFFFFIFVSVFNHACFSGGIPNISLAPMLQSAMPSIVNIRAQIKITDFETLREVEKQQKQEQSDSQDKDKDNNQALPKTFVSVGSGVIVDAKNGYILTNSHVVNDAQIVAVTLGDGRHYTAKIIGLDKPSDIAVLQIKAKNLTGASLGDSNQLKVGDFVAAIGNPFGLSQSVTSGIISALGRTTLGIENYENFIQTDAPINPGNSGGALINLQGQVIGINTAILAPNRGSIGIGFAIPINMAKSVMSQLLEFGDVKRGVLGISAQDITPELASAFNITNTQGAVVTQIMPNSPAELGGLQVGDIITSVNNVPIKAANDVVNVIGFLRVDSKTSINLLRNNKNLTVNVTISDPKKRKLTMQQLNPFLYGVGLKDFQLLSSAHGKIEGVMLVAVEEDTNAWRSDLRTGDVIISVNQQKIKTAEELKVIASKTGKTLLLNVLRGPGAIFLVISKEEA